MKEKLFQYIISLGDNPLILGQRLGEWCGHGPILEVDMALTNISLDLLGQTRSYFQYAAELEGKGRTEDDLAFLREIGAYRNVLLVEQPNEDFAYTIVRQFFFDAYHHLLLEELLKSQDSQLAAIAEKSLKEVSYHLRFSSEWVIRLGDGTEESHQKMQTAVDDLWRFTSELVMPTALEEEMLSYGIGADIAQLADPYFTQLNKVLEEATLSSHPIGKSLPGGKVGQHSEYLGHILSDMQYLQRAYPGVKW